MLSSRPVNLLVSILSVLALGFSSVPLAAAAPAGQAPPFPPGARFVPNEVIIQFKDSASDAEKAGARSVVGAFQKRVLRTLAATQGKGDLELAEFPGGPAIDQIIRVLESQPAVEFAEPNFIYTRQEASNDPYYTNGSLWGMYGDGSNPANQFGSQATEAWAAGHVGSNAVYVGIIDEGIQYTHPDLSANMWSNPYDTTDGVDNDANGYTDDVRGWDFYSNNNSIYDGTGDDHGTHVTGTIAAKGGNGAGVAGVNWNVTYISGKFLGPNGGYTSDAIEAVDYFTGLKTRHGLNIVATNNSWGGGGYSQGLYDAIQRANNADILFVAAAGNGGSDGVGDNNDTTPHYPSSYTNSNVIAVASITSSGAKSGFSNYGATSVDLGAPGSGIYSTLPDNTYGSYSGTSMATPHVSGAAALYGSVSGSATAEQTKKWILDNTIPTSSLNGRTVTGGRLNLGALAAPTAPLAPSNLSAAASSGQVTLTWIDNSGNEEGFKVERSLDGTLFTELAPTAGPNATSYSDTAVQPLTTYHYRVRAFNAVGPSGYSNTTTTTTPGAPVPPASPSELVATASSSSEVSLTWKDNSADEDGFKIERCQGVGCTSFAEIGQVGFSSTTNVSYKDTTVTGGTFYRYQVRAYNAGGSSGYSNIAEATTPAPPTAPAAPSELKLTVASSSRIDLAWKDNSGNETGFKIERSTNGTSFTQITSLGPDVTSYSNTSLSSGTRYYYRVRANNTAGNSGYSNTASAATSKPSAPSNLTASAISSNQINLAWSDKSDNETGFKIYRSTDGSNFTQIATVDRNVTTYSSTGLSPNKKYYYRVRAYNGVGNSSNSNSANATTKAS